MPNNDSTTPIKQCDDISCWLEHETSIMLKAVTKFNDPVELTADEARDIANVLLSFAERLEPIQNLDSN